MPRQQLKYEKLTQTLAAERGYPDVALTADACHRARLGSSSSYQA
jgi:hypothetical protein